VIVPVAPGGAADTVGRTLASGLSATLNQQFLIENRSGGGSIPGIESVARAEPDGHTLMVSGFSTQVVALPMNKSFDPIKDFSHIAYFGGVPVVLVVHPSLKVKNFGEFLALAKKESIEYVSPVFGSAGHLVAESLASKTGITLRHVAYRGGAPAILDLVAGHVKAGFLTWSTTVGHIQSDGLIPIAVTAPNRLPKFPDVPTFKELGYEDLVVTSWFGLSGPANLPKFVIDRLNHAVNVGMTLPEVRGNLDKHGILTKPMTAEEFTAFVQSEVEKWTPAAKALGQGK
jgi:tripartite-type tricarboxylate transporter receptor subunit TctC